MVSAACMHSVVLGICAPLSASLSRVPGELSV